MSKAQRADLKLPVIAGDPMIGSESRGRAVPDNAGERGRGTGVDARRAAAAESRRDAADGRAGNCWWGVGCFEGP